MSWFYHLSSHFDSVPFNFILEGEKAIILLGGWRCSFLELFTASLSFSPLLERIQSDLKFLSFKKKKIANICFVLFFLCKKILSLLLYR